MKRLLSAASVSAQPQRRHRYIAFFIGVVKTGEFGSSFGEIRANGGEMRGRPVSPPLVCSAIFVQDFSLDTLYYCTGKLFLEQLNVTKLIQRGKHALETSCPYNPCDCYTTPDSSHQVSPRTAIFFIASRELPRPLTRPPALLTSSFCVIPFAASLSR